MKKGGAERYAANLCRCLAEAGHTVIVVAETFDPAVHPDIVHIPVRVNRTTSASRTRSFHERSQEEVAKLEADAVLALSRTFPADAFRVSDPLHRYWMEIRYPGAIRRFIERLNPRHRAILALEDGILDPANTRMIITNSELSRRLIGELYDYPAEQIHVVYNGVDLQTFSPSPASKETGTIRLLFVGQDFRRKGLAPLLEALSIAVAAGHTPSLRVIGRDDPKPYRALAETSRHRGSRVLRGAYRENPGSLPQRRPLRFPHPLRSFCKRLPRVPRLRPARADHLHQRLLGSRRRGRGRLCRGRLRDGASRAPCGKNRPILRVTGRRACRNATCRTDESEGLHHRREREYRFKPSDW